MTGMKPPRNHLAEVGDLSIMIRVDAELLDCTVQRGAEAAEQVAAAERVAERARAIVRAATAVGRAAARRGACDDCRPLSAAAIGDLRARVRAGVAAEIRARRG